MKAANILETIGNTPHIRINRLFGDAEVWVKSERANPGASIKDRIALAMIEDAEKSGKLQPGGTIIEPTSGNTGIGLAMVAAVKGYKLVLVMPDSMSVERRRLMLAYGATFDLTPREKGQALETLRSGWTSGDDQKAMIAIVKSCETKGELEKVVQAAGGDINARMLKEIINTEGGRDDMENVAKAIVGRGGLLSTPAASVKYSPLS